MRGRGTGARDGSGDRSYELSLLSDFHPDTHLRVVRGYLPVQQSRKGGVWGVLKKINKGVEGGRKEAAGLANESWRAPIRETRSHETTDAD